MKVAAVVVTYNRIDLLKKVLGAVRKQTRPLDLIVVVNNNSTDGTREWLSREQNLTVIHQENLGGAGGFSRGIVVACEGEADWIWVMDDDVIANSDALEIMLGYTNVSECITPTRMFSDGEEVRWGGIYDLRKRAVVFGTRPCEQDRTKKWTVINTACFEGMLISKNIVSKIGFPDQRFFISGDDTIYGLRASRYTNVINVRDAVLMRAKSSREQKAHSPLFLYYLFRNLHLFEEYYSSFSGGNKYSTLTYLKYYYCAFLYLRDVYCHNRQCFAAALKAVLRGIYDSRRKSVGNTFVL